MQTPENIKKFAAAFSRLPGIGPRQALRLAFYLAETDHAFLNELKAAITGLEEIKLCGDCFFPHAERGALCSVCEGSNRNKSLIAVVEKATDYLSLEKTRKFNGRYLVLGDLKKTGVLEPEQKVRLETLKSFIKEKLSGKAEEIILATNPTAYGDLNASMLKTELEPFAVKFTRLGRGIPTGGEIEFADEETLSSALEGRG